MKDGEIKVTSTDIKVALSQRNPKDYFLTEVKNGSSWMPPAQGLLIFDGIGIRRSYASPCITIYEIKVSRADFLQDPKWKLYMQYCHEFYFVVPKGLISKDELPKDVGLIYYNPETKKLVTKQKAKYRQCENPYEVYQYIIYSRLTENPHPFYEKRAEYARDYLRDKADKRYLGKQFGSKMAQDIEEMAKRLDHLKNVEEKAKFYDDVCELLQKHGEYFWPIDTAHTLERLEERISGKVNVKQLEHVKNHLEIALRRIKEMEENDEVNTEISGE